mmetsp:Transcript_11395/g.15950  ORF Transcript_11395/g.15950 Transcript_11395/m.15950 type:complete len:215 (+) Transcript_11395:302-946(+)|eukprot:CAMPEP_0184487472 /NCGR_PEP_ID=MMETSP0113_2-20130426/10137_1 /TAXON_ID=91329 /ORGANISM="Norrisiella sphaerica, Strain BC52" /LENGTH=214 /DNA_ID=CAMNT_0026869803 /DNA_START=296 /DNA_END=940 /DNA_ORIENTATION=-
MSVSGYFPEAKRLYLNLQRKVASLEAKAFDEGLYTECANDARELGNRIRYLEMLVQQEGRGRREMWIGRISGLADNHMSLEKALTRMESAYQKRARSRQMREKLFGTKDERDAMRAQHTAYQTYQRNQESLKASNAEADRILETGRATLDNLRKQGDILKRAHRKVLDVANTLGLSNSLIKMIERRENMDKILVFAGMAVSLLVLFLLYYFLVR